MLNQTRAYPSQTYDTAWSTGEHEAQLVARAKADRQAFAPLYSRYLDPVYRYCYRRLGSREAAEDATAEVFYKALAALPGYRDGSFGGWLMTIAHNVVTDSFRRRPPEEPLDPDYDPPATRATPRSNSARSSSRSGKAVPTR